MVDFWRLLAHHLKQGRRVFLALVVGNTRHSPGTIGARLLVADGVDEVHGTIGGGIMEHQILARARDVLATDALATDSIIREIQTLHHNRSSPGERSGMICAGHQTNLYYLCRPAIDLEVIQQLLALQEKGLSGTLEISPHGLTVRTEPPNLASPPFKLEQTEGGWSYQEELQSRKRLAIFGGGHCALALARVMQPLGYQVLVFESRKKPPAAELENHAHNITIVERFSLAGAQVPYAEITPLVVMTSDFPSDVDGLAGALPLPFPFIGVMGSPAKISEIHQQLEGRGFQAADLERLTAPVGLPIGSNTPAEIAVSIAAQLIQQQNYRSA